MVGQEAGEENTQNDLKVLEENTTTEEIEALGESLGKGDDHKDMDIITKFLKVSAVGKGRRPLRMCRKLSYTGNILGRVLPQRLYLPCECLLLSARLLEPLTLCVLDNGWKCVSAFCVGFAQKPGTVIAA